MTQDPTTSTVTLRRTLVVEDQPPSSSPAVPVIRKDRATTNLVRPALRSMLALLRASEVDVIGRRITVMEELQEIHDQNLQWIVDAFSCLNAYEGGIENGLLLLPDMIEMFSNHAQFYSLQFHESTNTNCPIPDLRCIDHPSPVITQTAYSELLWEIATLLNRTERHLRLAELMYCDFDETKNDIQKLLAATFDKLQDLGRLRFVLSTETERLERTFQDSQHKVQAFLNQWETGPEELNLPEPPPLPDIPSFSSSSSASSPLYMSGESSLELLPSDLDDSLVGSGGHMQERSRSPPRSPLSSPEPPVLEASKQDSDPLGVEGVIQRFNDFCNTVVRQCEILREQQEIFGQSVIANKSLYENVGSPSP